MINGKNISSLVKEAYETAVEKGWHEEKREFGTLIALVHTEIKEALEAEDETHAAEELADILIRIFDLSGLYQLDLETAFNQLTEEDFDHMNNKVYSGEKFKSSFGLVSTLFCLYALDLHGDLSEALENYRKKEQDEKEIAISLAKVVKRTLAIGVEFDLKVEEAVVVKMEKNKKRDFKHGGKRI